MLSKADMTRHANRCAGAKADILAQVQFFRNSTGDVKECYKKIILDKCWKLNKMCGEFYHKELAAVSKIECEMLQINSLGRGRAILPQVEQMLEEDSEAREEMFRLSNTSVVPPESDPLG